MKENNHFEGAYALMQPTNYSIPGDPVPVPILPSEHNIESAKVWATLALAYEQRTANLIAMATAKYADGSAMFASLMGPSGEGLVSEIKERMGL